MKGLFEVIEGVERDEQTYRADDRSGLDNAEGSLKELEGKLT